MDTASWEGIEIGNHRYRVAKLLCRGGMGEVYLASDRSLQTDVIIKVPRAALLDEAEFAERFAREIRSLIKLQHPHIAHVIDVGEQEGRPFAVLEYLPGGTLGDRQRCEKDSMLEPMPVESLAEWLDDIASALDFIHRQGYVHRDVKPSNIMFDADGNPYLTDFGIAKVVAESEAESIGKPLTASGHAMGTSEYMAPEICRGESPDGRSDQYALAVTVYQTLSGDFPIRGSTPLATIHLQTKEIPPPLSEKVPSVSTELSDVIARGLAKEPKQRFSNCVDFATAALAPISQAATVHGTTAGQTLAPPGTVSGDAVELPHPESSHITCPSCGRKLKLPRKAEGRRLKCPACAANIRVSAGSTVTLEQTETAGHATAQDTDQQTSTKGSRPSSSPFIDAEKDVVSTSDESLQHRTEIASKRITWLHQRRWILGAVGGGVLSMLLLVVLILVLFNRPSGNRPDQHAAQSNSLPNVNSAALKPSPPSRDKPDRLTDPFTGKGLGQERDDNDLNLKLCWCPPGAFTMGSPKDEKDRDDDEDQVQVTLTKGFWLGKYEVTQAQYKRVMSVNPSSFSRTGSRKDRVKGQNTNDFPVETVSWEDAVEFCRKLSNLPSERQAGHRYRLPTEAEWEYACRAGTQTPFHFGSVLNGSAANIDGNYPYGTETKGVYLQRPTSVGSYKPNGFGLLDMHGNVYEWCQNWYDKDYYGKSSKVDPQGPSSGSSRVLRGGSWYDVARNARSAGRYRSLPDLRDDNIGFRVVCEFE